VVSQDRHKAASVGQDDQLIENTLLSMPRST
jgi:hypothetical protein